MTVELLDRLYQYADEFLIHAVDVEGKASGIERELVELLGSWNRIPVTYAGGIGSFQNLEELAEWIEYIAEACMERKQHQQDGRFSNHCKSAEKADIDRERKTYAGVSFEIRRSFHC